MHTLEELGDALLDGRDTVAGAVGANAADILQQPPGPLNDIGLVSQVVDEHVLLLQELGVLEETGYLAEEGKGLLVELLGVADVGGDDLVEGQVVSLAAGDLGAVLLRLDGQLATDGVLGLLDVGVDVVGSESHGGILAMLSRAVLLVMVGLGWRGNSGGGGAKCWKDR